jgi:hypothetical protein
VIGWAPPKWVALLEYHLRPHIREPWGGAFNGQRSRQGIFLELIERMSFRVIIETGTFRGSATEFLADGSRLPVHTVESNPRFFHYAAHRLRHRDNVHPALDDSRSFLRRLAADAGVPKRGAFFYLDAHWHADLPLREELDLITEHWEETVIMVDDFKVPGDEGYGFDDYGGGRCLCLDYVRPQLESRLAAFFPTTPSHQETGRRRGCVVLADAAAAPGLESVSSLRPHRPAEAG